MILTKEQTEELKEASKPLVKFLCALLHPHVMAMVDPTGCEILEGKARVKIEEFIKD